MKSSKQNQVGNFEKLVSFTNAQGAVYNPGKASIKSAALQTLLTQAQGAIQAAYVSHAAFANAMNTRNQAMETVPRLATRIIGALQASGVSKETLASCRAVKRKLYPNGKESRELVASGNETVPSEKPKQRSTSQTDIDSVIANFQQLVTMATSDPLYKPNEAELQLAGLNTFITGLRDKNKAVTVAKVAMKEANRNVDNLLFSAAGIYGQVQLTKGYIKSLYGFGSSKYKELTALKFRAK